MCAVAVSNLEWLCDVGVNVESTLHSLTNKSNINEDTSRSMSVSTQCCERDH